mmetsp:Transcript_3489/g.6249  ORF Transcript_3489/g.6249 Transcript_3489/m.6249 type:complete len:267 (-) Transcript_3489:41-841(-)
MPLDAILDVHGDHFDLLHSRVLVEHSHLDPQFDSAPLLSPSRPPHRLLRSAVHTAFASENAPGDEVRERSIMEIQGQELPSVGQLETLSNSCRLKTSEEVFGDSSSHSATKMGSAVGKSAKCAESVSQLVLSDLFGKKMPQGGHGVGVALAKTHEIPLGSLNKKSLISTQKSCEDFATVLLHRFEKPGTKLQCPEKGGSNQLSFTSQDATHALKSFGLCLDSIGETSALQGCEMGNLQAYGTNQAAHICQSVEGPAPEGLSPCSIL